MFHEVLSLVNNLASSCFFFFVLETASPKIGHNLMALKKITRLQRSTHGDYHLQPLDLRPEGHSGSFRDLVPMWSMWFGWFGCLQGPCPFNPCRPCRSPKCLKGFVHLSLCFLAGEFGKIAPPGIRASGRSWILKRFWYVIGRGNLDMSVMNTRCLKTSAGLNAGTLSSSGAILLLIDILQCLCLWDDAMPLVGGSVSMMRPSLSSASLGPAAMLLACSRLACPGISA